MQEYKKAISHIWTTIKIVSVSGIRPAACKTFTLVTVVRLKIKASLVVLAFLQTF